jgi:hypothetical protein
VLEAVFYGGKGAAQATEGDLCCCLSELVFEMWRKLLAVDLSEAVGESREMGL